MGLLTKKKLVSELAKEAGIRQKSADFYYDVFMDIVINALEKGNDVLLLHVGCIKLVKTKGFRSNLTGVSIPNHKRIKFKPNIELARKIRIITRERPI